MLQCRELEGVIETCRLWLAQSTHGDPDLSCALLKCAVMHGHGLCAISFHDGRTRFSVAMEHVPNADGAV